MNLSHIVGWGHTPIGKLDAADPEQLVRQAIEPALQTAGFSANAGDLQLEAAATWQSTWSRAGPITSHDPQKRRQA